MDSPATAERAEQSSADPARLAATVDRLRAQVHQVRAAAAERAVVDLAKGVLVERLGISPAQAARQLARLAEQAGLSRVELAADILDQADTVEQIARQTVDQSPPGAVAVAARNGHASVSRSVAGWLRAAESVAADAADTQAVAESLLEHALAPLGACAAAVWAAGADGSLRLAGSAGFTDEDARRWHYVPPDVPTAARRALVERGPVWTEGGSTAPTIGCHQRPEGARVVLPAAAGGRVLGVLEVCWPGPVPALPAAGGKQLGALAELCAHTLDADRGPAAPASAEAVSELAGLADGLLDPTLVLVPLLDADGWLADFRVEHVNPRFRDPAGRPPERIVGAPLLEAYPLAAQAGGLFDKIQRVHATGEPFHTERMPVATLVDNAVHTVEAAVGISRLSGGVLLTCRVLDDTTRLAALLQHTQRLGGIGGFEENLVSGEITWSGQLFELHGLPPTAPPIPLRQLAARAHPDDATAIGRFLRTLLYHRRPASTAIRLRAAEGATRHSRVIAEPVLDDVGNLVAVLGAYQDVSAQHWTEVALAATRDQLAHTEQESAERNRLALQLQRAIMPSAQDPIDVPGLRVAARYRPAEKGHLVGGDWYDSVVLPGGGILLSVGDIAGHGIDAATGMVLLRNALRGLAATGAAPDQLLAWLNVVAHNLTERVLATALCGVYDPDTRVLTWARAGHLPPVLLRDGRATSLSFLSGMLLGARADARYEQGQVELRPGDTLLMYTDGLIERRDCAVDDSLARLLRTAEGQASDVDDLLDRLLTHSNADTDDDTCIVGIRLLERPGSALAADRDGEGSRP
ncbi:SpoIIE family protein phosphatase [Actinokineospora iranica]|uniref:Serine phosphatase RsbU, regulator of sigma subunit n=1 Tax=Actinokineospora iranica TaxID=1271860 RepID=A0A1G6K0A2_9PSEU|nr:SpoIIE family protein phosphatase [Actinokineospora iranica]SDC24489.1 Serine phosphatase RsbU, regulator of sigma subunit [Actinokineospora iranica]